MSIETFPKPLRKEIADFHMEILMGRLVSLTLQFDLLENIKAHQGKDSSLLKVQLFNKENTEFTTSADGIVYFKRRICVPDVDVNLNLKT